MLPIDLQCFDSIFRQDEAVVFEIENLPGTLEDVLVVIDQENELALAFGIENESIARGVDVGRDFAKRNLRGNARAGSGRWRGWSRFAGADTASRTGEDACGDAIEDGLRGARGQFDLLIESVEIFAPAFA